MVDNKFRYYRVLINDHVQPKDLSPTSQQLQNITGFFSNEYIKPALPGGSLLNIIADESIFKTHYCSSIIIAPYMRGTSGQYDDKLERLITKFGLNDIHFNNLYSSRTQVNSKIRLSFIDNYLDVIKDLQLACLAISVDRKYIPEEEKMGNDEIHFTLF